MKLDPCPWCKKPPKILDSDLDKLILVDLIAITCCHATLVCAKEDAEEMWNWV